MIILNYYKKKISNKMYVFSIYKSLLYVVLPFFIIIIIIPPYYH